MEIVPLCCAVGGYITYMGAADRTPVGAFFRSYLWGAFFAAGAVAFFYTVIFRIVVCKNWFAFNTFRVSKAKQIPMQVSGDVGRFKKLAQAIKQRHMMPFTLAGTAEHAFLDSQMLDDFFGCEDDMVFGYIKANPGEYVQKLFYTMRCKKAENGSFDPWSKWESHSDRMHRVVHLDLRNHCHEVHPGNFDFHWQGLLGCAGLHGSDRCGAVDVVAREPTVSQDLRPRLHGASRVLLSHSERAGHWTRDEQLGLHPGPDDCEQRGEDNRSKHL
jgi:hypothetical protein